MPEIKCEHIDQCCSASSILQSIALQEAGLSHIINAEGEKIQKVVQMCDSTVDDLIDINSSVESMIEKITSLELVLKSKIDSVMPLLCECKKNPHHTKNSLIFLFHEKALNYVMKPT